MNVSAKTEYACIAVLALAASYSSGQPVRIRKIADAHGIPSRFLVQILLQLKSAGIVSSTRGAAGGYTLIRDPEEITLGEVMSVIEGPMGQFRSNTESPTPTSLVLSDVWNHVAGAQFEMLDGVTFDQLRQRAKGSTENMYYI